MRASWSSGCTGPGRRWLSTASRGIAGSAASFAFGLPWDGFGVGASGAIFGLFGVVLIATRFHHAVLDARSRSIAGQVGFLIVINLVLGLSGIFTVDNFAHVGGLLAGVWLALVIPPSQVQTLASVWQAPRNARSRGQAVALRIVGVVALLAVIGATIAYGTSKWQQDPHYRQLYGLATPTTQPAVAALGAAAGPVLRIDVGG